MTHQMALGLFRTMASVSRDMIIANTFGSAALLLILLLGGFLVPKSMFSRSLPVQAQVFCFRFSSLSICNNKIIPAFRLDQALVGLGFLDITIVLRAARIFC